MPIQVTKDFNQKEFLCKCSKPCHGKRDDAFDWTFVPFLQAVRDEFGPIRITSAARCPDHNAAVGGAPASEHLANPDAGVTAAAVDVAAISEADRYLLVKLAIKHGFTNIRIAGTFVHIDRRQGPGKMGLY